MKTLKILFWNFALSMFAITSGLTADVISASTPIMDLDSNGNAVAIWQAWDDNYSFVIRGATMSSGGFWNLPTTISDPDYASFVNSPLASQCLSVNDAGNAVAVWTSYVDEIATVFASRLVDSVWETTPVGISSLENAAFFDVTVSLDNTVDENISLLWTSYVDVNAVIRGATGTLRGGWSSPFTIDP